MARRALKPDVYQCKPLLLCYVTIARWPFGRYSDDVNATTGGRYGELSRQNANIESMLELAYDDCTEPCTLPQDGTLVGSEHGSWHYMLVAVFDAPVRERCFGAYLQAEHQLRDP